MADCDHPYSIVGYFDPRFIGVALTFDNQEDWSYWWPWSFDDTLGERAIAEIGQGTDGSDASLFRRMFLMTAFEHECRHFHDYLLSPLGCHLFRIRIGIAINALQIVYSFRFKPQQITVLSNI